jgi:hypothetical protein
VLREEFLYDALKDGAAPDPGKYVLHSGQSQQDKSKTTKLDKIARRLSDNQTIIAAEEGAEKKMRVRVKDGSVVQPDSGLAEIGRVYQDHSNVYNAVLNITDITSGLNSFYLLQLIVHDTKPKWFVYIYIYSQNLLPSLFVGFIILSYIYIYIYIGD